MKKILLLTLLLSSTIALGQFSGYGKKGPSIKGVIKGVLLDEETKEPLPYASIVLQKAGKDLMLDGVLSDDSGAFKIEKVKNGDYELVITYLGYEDKIIKDVKPTLKKPDVNLGKIAMTSSSKVIEGVEIKAERALVENKVDRIVFNAENDSSVSGGDATDVLRKVPMLNVDLDGNVSLRGSQNIKILINDKPSGMFASNTSEALKMFPADQIKKVEVITSPSAKYDGEGSAGIINIITKGENIEGIAGSVNLSGSNRQNSAVLSLNAGKGRFGLSSNMSAFYMVPTDADNTFYRKAGDILTSNQGNTETSRLGFRGGASAFYDFNAYNALNTSFNIRGFGFGMNSTVNGKYEDASRSYLDTYMRSAETNTLNSGFDWSTDYTRKFERDEDQELVLAFQYSGNIQDQKYNLREPHNESIRDRYEDVINDGNNDEWTMQLDYTHPFSKAVKLETGIKGVLRDIISDYTYKKAESQSSSFVVDPTRTNIFNYNQDVLAGYMSSTFVIAKKYSLIAGLRYEQTRIAGDYNKKLSDRDKAFDNTYANWLPNFTIARTLSGFRKLKLSYSRRLERPSLFYINPFNNQSDLYNQTYGNPFVKPEVTDQIEVGYNFNVAGFSVFMNSYYKHTNDIIESTIRVNDAGVSINSFDNVGTNNAVGLNLFTSKSIGAVTLRGGGDFYTYNASGTVNGEKLKAQDILYSLFFNGDYKITKTIKSDFFGFFMAPRRTLQGVNPGFSMMGFGLRKEYGDWSFGLRVVEPFRPTKSFNSELKGAGFEQRTTFEIPFRSVGINVRYKFGKVDFKARKSKVKNTDLKSGEGGSGQQGGGGRGGM